METSNYNFLNGNGSPNKGCSASSAAAAYLIRDRDKNLNITNDHVIRNRRKKLLFDPEIHTTMERWRSVEFGQYFDKLVDRRTGEPIKGLVVCKVGNCRQIFTQTGTPGMRYHLQKKHMRNTAGGAGKNIRDRICGRARKLVFLKKVAQIERSPAVKQEITAIDPNQVRVNLDLLNFDRPAPPALINGTTNRNNYIVQGLRQVAQPQQYNLPDERPIFAEPSREPSLHNNRNFMQAQPSSSNPRDDLDMQCVAQIERSPAVKQEITAIEPNQVRVNLDLLHFDRLGPPAPINGTGTTNRNNYIVQGLRPVAQPQQYNLPDERHIFAEPSRESSREPSLQKNRNFTQAKPSSSNPCDDLDMQCKRLQARILEKRLEKEQKELEVSQIDLEIKREEKKAKQLEVLYWRRRLGLPPE